ncbi:MAG: FliM/FliN family flagellar motor switch protein [Pseudomonadota bacterium]
MNQREDSILKRKVRGPKMRISGFPAMDPFCNAFASLSATMSRKELRSGIDVSIFGYEVVRHADYLKFLRAPSAIYLLAFEETNGNGLAKAHPRLLSKVLDISLGGDGSFEESGAGRPLTSVDLAIYGRFVDLVNRAFDETIKELCGRNVIGAPRKTRFEEQPGMIRIAPDRAEVFVIKMNFHIADDARGAGLDFVVPVTVLEPLKKDLNRVMTSNEATLALWARYMYDQVLDLPIEANGVLPLGEFTVGELTRLTEGMFIELPDTALNEVQLQVDTIEGAHTLTKGRLGVAGRNKALRVLEDPDPQFVRPLLEMARPR